MPRTEDGDSWQRRMYLHSQLLTQTRAESFQRKDLLTAAADSAIRAQMVGFRALATRCPRPESGAFLAPGGGSRSPSAWARTSPSTMGLLSHGRGARPIGAGPDLRADPGDQRPEPTRYKRSEAQGENRISRSSPASPKGHKTGCFLANG